MTEDFEQATRYLRGELAGDEHARFEERVLTEDELHAVVRVAEDELLDAFATGTLHGAARARMAARLEIDPVLRARLQIADGLATIARKRAAPKPAARRWWWFAAPLVAAVGLAAVAVVVSGDRTKHPAPVVTVALAAPTRASAVPDVRLPDGVPRVRLELDVEPQPGLAIAVRGPNGPVAATLISTKRAVAVEVDAAALADGLHDLTVSAAGTPVAAFQFRIVR